MRALPQLLATRQLLAIEAASIPHMTDASRKKVMARYLRRASNERPKTASEAMATLPIPVVYEPVSEEVTPDA